MMNQFNETKCITNIDQKCSDFLERVFLMSVDGELADKTRILPRTTVFMINFINEHGIIKICNLKNMLCERIRMTDLNEYLMFRCDVKANEDPENNPIKFLYNSYERLCCEKVYDYLLETFEETKKVIVNFIGDNLKNPLMLNHTHKETSPNVHESFYKLVEDPSKHEQITSLFYDLSSFFTQNQISTMVKPLIQKLSNSINFLDIDDYRLYQCCSFVKNVSEVEKIAFCIVTCKIKTTGLQSLINKHDLMTILGTMLRKTCMFTGERNQVDFYNKNQHLQPLQIDEDVHSHTQQLHSAVYQIFRNILKHEKTKKQLLIWIGNLIKNFEYVAKLYHHEFRDENVHVTDAVFFNLSSVMVKISLPYCVDINCNLNKKWLKIDPTYCRATGLSDRLDRKVHCDSLHKMTCIIKNENSQDVKFSETYNFITEWFFLTHRVLYMGNNGLIVKYENYARDLQRLTSQYEQAKNFAFDDLRNDLIIKAFEVKHSLFYSVRGTMSEPHFVSNCIRFYLTTSTVLNQLACTNDRTSVAKIHIPLNSEPPIALNCIPEFVVENVINFIHFINSASTNSLMSFVQASKHLINFISIYMTDKRRMTNIHLRSRFGEVLEAILPVSDKNNRQAVFCNVLEEFNSVEDLTKSCFQLFVDIQFTGDDNTAFSQKFNLRGPLFNIIKFLWEDDRAINAVKKLSLKAIFDIEKPNAPLMLSFVDNFLNDSNWCMVESFENMKSIKKYQDEKDYGEWEALSNEEKDEKESELERLIGIARFYNHSSIKMIEMISYLSSEAGFVKLITHPVLVQRISDNFNLYLKQITGPQQRQIKVDNKDEVNFDPKKLLLLICSVYERLGTNLDFLRAVVKDDRSYDVNLFRRTENVLYKSGEVDIARSINTIAQTASKLHKEQEDEEEIWEEAPDHFDCQLSGYPMKEPVILPSSNTTVNF